MKHILLPVALLLSVASFAQSGYNPSQQMQLNRQSQQNFNRSTSQRNQEFNRDFQQRQRGTAARGERPMSKERLLLTRAKQQQREQAATEKLAQLTQQQQHRREQQPAANPQQAALQQQKDNQQLTLLTVRNYREVFLPGQVSDALQAQQLSPEAQRHLRELNERLTNKSWWKKQEGAQLTANLTAYSDTLTSIITNLLGFDLASPPSITPPPSTAGIDAQLATHVFDRNAAGQLIREAALIGKLVAGEGLAKAVSDFSRLSAAAATGPQSNPKKLKEDVEMSLRLVNREMDRYNAHISTSLTIFDAEDALLKSTADYLAKNRK